MKFAAIFLVSCIISSSLPGHFSQGVEPTGGQDLVWCPSKDVFNGSCSDRGSPSQTCFLDFLGSRSASAMPKNCQCTPQPNNQRLCQCLVVCNRL
ncbi:PREDICTED: putative defensin-like protein 244 [Tarenaya hassleriana]|uniref:putative defensin-like protein 244 n=1 Tax=Tarenaya hassleriana TaxID=28532 RepID=UPI00053C22C5|nr:PREDICTED: putative defensin-like protein 244 [Tarenaya hassleriana]